MALQTGALRTALLDAGASEEWASRVADELASHEDRFARIESDLLVMKWMAGVLLAVVGLLNLIVFA